MNMLNERVKQTDVTIIMSQGHYNFINEYAPINECLEKTDGPIIIS